MTSTNHISNGFISFSAIVGQAPKILILGTAPGKKSLSCNEYYASPKNCFWRIMSEFYGKDFANYPEKKECLKRNHIALWDVYKSGSRIGSADKSIRDKNLTAITDFLKEHHTIKKIIFNGKMAQREFNKLKISGYQTHLAPSTSNAYTIRYEQKFLLWSQLLQNP